MPVAFPALPLTMLAALCLDRLLGEPRRLHPLVGFGWLAERTENALRRGAPGRPLDNRLRGLLGWLALVAPPVALAVLASWFWQRQPWAWAADVALLYFALGGRSLAQHGARVAADLAAGDLDAARRHVGWLVSRDTATLDEAGVAGAAVESVLENGNDAVFGALFWFAIGGGAGALLFRLANTLDAMWGYRDARRLYFGWAAARIDDLLNFIPARLTALTYALLGKTRLAWRCWRTQAAAWASPNAGPVMAAGAGALGVCLGGAASYHGAVEARPKLGADETARPGHIAAALRLVARGQWLWLGATTTLALLGWSLRHA
jgi:adenosylcobinamide-phosphate synthase